MKSVWIIAGLAVLLSSAAIAQPREREGKQAQLAHAYYLDLCAGCHGAEGRGDGPSGRAYVGSPSLDLTRIAQRHGGSLEARELRALIEAHPEGWIEILRPSAGEQGRRSIARHRIALIAEHVEKLQQP